MKCKIACEQNIVQFEIIISLDLETCSFVNQINNFKVGIPVFIWVFKIASEAIIIFNL